MHPNAVLAAGKSLTARTSQELFPCGFPSGSAIAEKGVDSPVPTQVVSNEEFIPRPQNDQQKQVEALIGAMAEEKSKKLGMDRRAFMASSMGLATAFLASNMVYGNYWDVDEAETLEPAASEEKWPKGEYFIIDVQTHFTNGARPRLPQHGVRQEHGLQAQERRRSLRLPQLRQGDVLRQRDEHGRDLRRAGQGDQRGPDGKVLEGKARTPGLSGQSCRAG